MIRTPTVDPEYTPEELENEADRRIALVQLATLDEIKRVYDQSSSTSDGGLHFVLGKFLKAETSTLSTPDILKGSLGIPCHGDLLAEIIRMNERQSLIHKNSLQIVVEKGKEREDPKNWTIKNVAVRVHKSEHDESAEYARLRHERAVKILPTIRGESKRNVLKVLISQFIPVPLELLGKHSAEIIAELNSDFLKNHGLQIHIRHGMAMLGPQSDQGAIVIINNSRTRSQMKMPKKAIKSAETEPEKPHRQEVVHTKSALPLTNFPKNFTTKAELDTEISRHLRSSMDKGEIPKKYLIELHCALKAIVTIPGSVKPMLENYLRKIERTLKKTGGESVARNDVFDLLRPLS